MILTTLARTRRAEPPWLARVRLHAQRRVLWLRFLWSSGFDEAEQGLAITHSEVDRTLADPGELAEAEQSFFATDPEARQTNEAIVAVDRQVAGDERWNRLRRAFALSDHEADLLALAVAADVDPTLRRAYGYLHDDATAAYATPWLAAHLFGWPPGASVGPDAALACWRIARPLDGTAYLGSRSAPWTPDPSIVAYLLGEQDAATEQMAAPDEEHGCLYPEQLAAMVDFVLTMQAANTALEIELLGPRGSGRRTLAAQLGAALGRTVLAIDAPRLAGKDIEEAAIRAVRAARLSGAVLLWRDADRLGSTERSALHAKEALALFTSETPLEERPGEAIRRSFRLPPLRQAARGALWERLAGGPVPEPVADWMLSPGDISQAARAAPAGPEAVVEVCRQLLHQDPGELFVPLPCPYDWDDLVLPTHVERHLRELEDQARLRWPVYEDWGFERLCPMGRGISALFAGPSGTGKTMAAQVLARALGLNLYRVDLAGVMNKYIGETEKRLRQVFDRCERANVLLFFDEADALFGQRTQVKDAHDRFANIEIDYLLQRMEQFDGIAVLSTNRKSDLDGAFMRRLRFIVDFMPPGPQERLALWRRALPTHTPGGEEILEPLDWDFLADRLAMTGADIKATALGAAFRARAEGTRIGMRHVIGAARRELSKRGIVLREGEREA